VTCRVKVNRHGRLAFQIFWRGMSTWEGTGLPDTPENRQLVEAKAILITREIKNRKFDYLKSFPKGNKAEELNPKATIGEYYRVWIERKKPPVVRPGLERDYKEHFKRYILPKFEDVSFAELIPALLEAFRSYLIQERELSVKSVRNIIDASFRAMVRDARQVDYLLEKDPFEALQWPRLKTARPDPFTEEERDAILSYFREKRPHSFPFAYTLFFTGMRPSEALALRWGDVDLRRGELSISKSRYLDSEGAPKTAGSEREITFLDSVVEILRAIKPLHVTEDEHVFLNQDGNLLKFHTWRRKAWYPALRVKEVRERKPYTMRHTFISVGLTNGVNIKWLADYCGTSVTMIEKHYGKYIRNDSAEQLNRLFGVKRETRHETLPAQQQHKWRQAVGNIRERWKVGPPGFEPGTDRL
jgi:integrase